MTVDEFRGRFPEFEKIPREQIAPKLAEAERIVGRTTWGKFADDGVGNYAAHLLFMSPLGQPSKLKDKGESHYLATYERLRRIVALSPRVI